MNFLIQTYIAFIFLIIKAFSQSNDDHQVRGPKQFITCGSTIRLRNLLTGYYLTSHKTKNWEGGSRLQAVTGVQQQDDPNSLWIIKEKMGEPKCEPGQIIRCGDQVRLEHIKSTKNLHSRNFPALVNHEDQEASCFGENGEGDENDNFIVICRDYRLRHVKTFTRIYFLHENFRKYLYISWRKNDFNQQNCRNCPFTGEKEVAFTYHRDDQCVWEITDGIILPHETKLHYDEILEDEDDEDEY